MKSTAAMIRAYRLLCALCIFFAVLLLPGCAQQARTPESVAAYKQPQTEPDPPVTATPEQSVEDSGLTADLLQRAQRALARGRLSSAQGDGALELFQRVLSLQPDNAQANSGIDDIVVQYAQMARDDIAANRWMSAYTKIAQAEKARPGNPLLAELNRDLATARLQQQERLPAGSDEIHLQAEDLDRSRAQPSERLREIARRIQVSDESVVIVARSDAEGRWLYQQLRDAAQGQRLRGDIRIGRQVKIVFLPPL